ncbi:MAG: hypothetical protein JNK64_13825 [Myxococcales bacterium]|nr:hypothetical protein [Myxococcales bacterium]
MALHYTLTLSTTVDPARKATATVWSLTEGASPAVIASAACPGDEHGDHARADGRAAARKDALKRGLRIVDANVRVVYARPAAPPA